MTYELKEEDRDVIVNALLKVKSAHDLIEDQSRCQNPEAQKALGKMALEYAYSAMSSINMLLDKMETLRTRE